MQFERCAGELAQDLGDKKEKGIQWIKPFNETCAWFEERVVSADKVTPCFGPQGLTLCVGNGSEPVGLPRSQRSG